MQSAIQYAAFHYIACLKTTPTNADHSITIEGKPGYYFDNIRTLSNHHLHVDFQVWAAASVLRDLIESFSIMFYEVYERAAVNNPSGKFSTTPAIFERRGLEIQLGVLTTDFGIDSAWVSRLTGYNRARNCLAHRAGIVGKSDVTDDDELVVRWLVATVSPHDGPISKKINVQGPMGALVQGSRPIMPSSNPSTANSAANASTPTGS